MRFFEFTLLAESLLAAHEKIKFNLRYLHASISIEI